MPGPLRSEDAPIASSTVTSKSGELALSEKSHVALTAEIEQDAKTVIKTHRRRVAIRTCARYRKTVPSTPRSIAHHSSRRPHDNAGVAVESHCASNQPLSSATAVVITEAAKSSSRLAYARAVQNFDSWLAENEAMKSKDTGLKQPRYTSTKRVIRRKHLASNVQRVCDQNHFLTFTFTLAHHLFQTLKLTNFNKLYSQDARSGSDSPPAIRPMKIRKADSKDGASKGKSKAGDM